jgi:hypothetical protein
MAAGVKRKVESDYGGGRVREAAHIAGLQLPQAEEKADRALDRLRD